MAFKSVSSIIKVLKVFKVFKIEYFSRSDSQKDKKLL